MKTIPLLKSSIKIVTRPVEGVYSNLGKSRSKSLRDRIFAVKPGGFAKKPRKTPRISMEP